MSCKIYPPIKHKLLPQQFGPYNDIDPNSIIKYKKELYGYIPSFEYLKNMGRINILTWLKQKKEKDSNTLIENFDNDKFNITFLFIASLIIVIFILLIING